MRRIDLLAGVALLVLGAVLAFLVLRPDGVTPSDPPAVTAGGAGDAGSAGGTQGGAGGSDAGGTDGAEAPGTEPAAADGPGPNLVIEIAGGASGTVVIDLLPDVAPAHVARLTELAEAGAYDNVVFHRVIDGFMAQTGDVEFGKDGGDIRRAGIGGSDLPDLPAEFSNIPFDRGVVGMARAASPDSANSQFFIMFDEGHFLNGQYTVVGRVISGMEVIDAITRGDPGRNGVVAEPDVMKSVRVER